MYSNLSKGLMATPLAAVLPQTGNTVFATAIGILMAILAITLIVVEIKKRSS